MIRILTDSTSSIPPQLRSDLGIDTISLHVNYNGQEFEEATMDLDAFYADIYDMKNNPPTSSQPSPAAISAYLEEAAAADDQVIATCLSSRMSGTFESVVSIAAQVKERHPQFTYAVIDSTTNCMELGLPVIAGARQRNQGATFDQCVAAIRDAIHSTRFLFAPESLKFLEAGGRIGKAAALLGSLVKISPVLTVKDGAAETFAKVRTYKKALDKIVEAYRADTEGLGRAGAEALGLTDLAVHYIGSRTPAEQWARDVIEPLVGRSVLVTPASPVIGVHVGPAMGIAWQCARPIPGKFEAIVPEVVVSA